MHILHDWLEETSVSMASQGTDSAQSSTQNQYEGGEKAKGPQFELVKATEEAHARMQMKNQAGKLAQQQRAQARQTEAREIDDLATDLDNLHKLEMQRVKPSADDDQLLEGLDELRSKEKEELEKKRASFTPRTGSPRQPKEEEAPISGTQQSRAKEEERNDDGSGWARTAVIGAALCLAAIMIAKSVITKK